MSVPKRLTEFIGKWSGKNCLRMNWAEDKTPLESDSALSIKFAAKRKFVIIKYSWIYGDEKQEGQIILGLEKDTNKINAAWIDSWHNGDRLMVCEGNIENSLVALMGQYPVPDQPDWGWRTEIDLRDAASFQFRMYNVSPTGNEELAVESVYKRKTHISVAAAG